MEQKQPKYDYSDVHFKENGKLKLIIVVGTRPEIIRPAPLNQQSACTGVTPRLMVRYHHALPRTETIADDMQKNPKKIRVALL